EAVFLGNMFNRFTAFAVVLLLPVFREPELYFLEYRKDLEVLLLQEVVCHEKQVRSEKNECFFPYLIIYGRKI
ncbi:MAG: hypothetical protein ABIJ16_13780, partial [Bacteroidota bacterium]